MANLAEPEKVIQPLPNEDDEDFNDKLRDMIYFSDEKNPFSWRSGQPLSKEARRLLICYQFNLCRHFGDTKTFEAVARMTADAHGLSYNTIKKVFKLGDEAETPGKHRMKVAPKKTIDKFNQDAIRQKIYQKKARGEKISVSAVTKICQEEGLFFGQRSTMYAVLTEVLGFKFRRTDFRDKYKNTPRIQAWRREFLVEVKLAIKNGYTPVFLDETWIFQHGTNTHFDWTDGTPQCIGAFVNASNGQRYIVIHAGSAGGWIPGAGEIFPSKVMHLDYHGEMCIDYFMHWTVQKLLDNLPEKCAIIMDNASYHGLQLEKMPTKSQTKGVLMEWLQGREIPFNPKAKKPELLELCMANAPAKKSFVFDTLMETKGHIVIRNAPYYCEYNAIELAWAHSKREYDRLIHLEPKHTRDLVLEAWRKALEHVTPDIWAGCVKHVLGVIDKDFTELGLTLEQPAERIVAFLGDDSSDSEAEEDEEEQEKLRSDKEKQRREDLLKRRLEETKNNMLKRKEESKTKRTRRKILSESCI